MMLAPVGVRINNINGRTIIDDRFFNLMLRQKIVNPSFTARPAGNPRWRCVLDIPCSPDGLIAYTCFNAWWGIAIASKGNTENIRRIEIGASSFQNSAAPNITLYVFDKPEFAALAGAVGLRIRNRTTGEIAFDSRGKYMKILGYAARPREGQGVQSPVYFAGNGKIPAAVHVQTYRHNWSGTFDTGSGSVAESGEDVILCRNVDTRMMVAYEEWVYSTGGSGGGSSDSVQGSRLIMMVDVTDL